MSNFSKPPHSCDPLHLRGNLSVVLIHRGLTTLVLEVPLIRRLRLSRWHVRPLSVNVLQAPHIELSRLPCSLRLMGPRRARLSVERALPPIYARSAWLSYKRLHEERAYTMIAVSQIRKLTHAARSNTDVASVLRVPLVQELLRASLCCEERFEPFVTVLPGETESVLLVPYLMGIVLDWGEVVVVCGCGGGGKSCNRCTCMYNQLGDPVVEGFCAGGGTFRDGEATATWAAEREAAGTTYAPVSRADMMLFRSKPVRVSTGCCRLLALHFADVTVVSPFSVGSVGARHPTLSAFQGGGCSSRNASALHATGVYALLSRSLSQPGGGRDQESKRTIQDTVVQLVPSTHGHESGARTAYDNALDAVDRWGATFRPYARLGRRTMTQYHQGWTAATALFGWDHVNMLSMQPMLMGQRHCLAATPEASCRAGSRGHPGGVPSFLPARQRRSSVFRAQVGDHSVQTSELQLHY